MSGRETEGRFYPELTPAERQFIEKEAKRHNVTPNQMLEAMMLSFFKEHDQKTYEEAKEHADPKALKLIEKAKEAQHAKELETTKKIAKFMKIEDGEWWIEKLHGFYAILKNGKVTVPQELREKLELEEDQFVKVTVDTA